MTFSVINLDRNTVLAHDLRIADSYWKRLRGLLGTSASEFSEGAALWITPCRAIHSLMMRFPFDVLFLDAAQRVVHLENNFAPGRIGRTIRNAESVLELPAQSLRHSGTAVGDHIKFLQQHQATQITSEEEVEP
jgi:uncharacterized membrane protein (UPF0127 family)